MNKTISVVIPMYNAEKYIKECLASVLNQSVPFDEIIVVDDGSSDCSSKICKDYMKENDRIKLFIQSNSGAGVARNNGLKYVTGDYVVFLDADDLVTRNTCKIIKKEINKSDVDILYYSSEILGYDVLNIKISKHAYERTETLCETECGGFDSLKISYPNEFIMSACMGAYKMKFINGHNIKFLEDNLYEDRLFSTVTITEAEKVKYIKDKLYIRRFFDNTTSTSKASILKMQDAFKSHCIEWKYIISNEKWKKNIKLMQSYFLNTASMYLSNFVNTHDNKNLDYQYLKVFSELFYNIMKYDQMDMNDLCLLLHILNVSLDENIVLSMKSNVVNKLEVCLKNWCNKYFKENTVIALYGVGKHTFCLKKIIDKYGKYNIDDFCYIMSEKKKNESKDILFLDELTSEDIDRIDNFVLSSKVYLEDMYELLINHDVPPKKITKLYSARDSVDIVMIHDTLL